MGHTVKSVTGADVGGFQSIMFTADQNPPGARESGSVQRLNGFYRAGSDHRKDGQAVGW
jgi:gamma-glutamyltranspeptidase/glutathione hydrolase